MPHIARYSFREVSTPPKWCDTPPWYLVSHRHICAIPHFATYRAILVRYPMKTSTKEFCDTIIASIARYAKYRCWPSKPGFPTNANMSFCVTLDRPFDRLYRAALPRSHFATLALWYVAAQSSTGHRNFCLYHLLPHLTTYSLFAHSTSLRLWI